MMKKFLLPTFLLLMVSFCGNDKKNGKDPKATTEQKKPDEPDNEGDGVIHCFAYHRFGNNTYPSTNISLDKFRAHLEYLKQNDFTVLTLGEALDKMNSGKGAPDRTAVLTMDDGYKSIKTGAVPLLKEYGYKATIFVCTQYVGGRNNLSWEELKELQKKGYEIGNHSHSHTHFVNAPKDSIAPNFIKDVHRTNKIFKEQLGKEPDLYAYPYGEYHPDMKEVLKEEGYEAAVAQKSGVIHGKSDRYALPRFPMTSFYGQPEKFREKAGMWPLIVEQVEPEGPLIEDGGPPTLKFTIKNKSIDPNALQCFVDGQRSCDLEILSRDPIRVKVKSKHKLEDRRTLYTITAPGRNGKDWYWYSHLWVRPDKGE